MTLDGNVAAMNTESIAHRGYVEGNYRFSEYLAISVGGKACPA
jgi:hypothetical protein